MYYNLADTEDSYKGLFGHGAGGSLHIVLDDGNIDDESVDFCIQDAIEHKDAQGEQLANKIRQLHWRQRARLYLNYHLYCYGAPMPNVSDELMRFYGYYHS